MRTIQKISVPAYEGPDKMVTVFTIRIPKDSIILSATQFADIYIIWFEGTADEHAEFEDHKLGAFKPEDPIPNGTLRFHSAFKKTYREAMFLYEFRTL